MRGDPTGESLLLQTGFSCFVLKIHGKLSVSIGVGVLLAYPGRPPKKKGPMAHFSRGPVEKAGGKSFAQSWRIYRDLGCQKIILSPYLSLHKPLQNEHLTPFRHLNSLSSPGPRVGEAACSKI